MLNINQGAAPEAPPVGARPYAPPAPDSGICRTSTRDEACTPVPRLRLFADEVVIHVTEGLGSRYETEKVPLLALCFDYGGQLVRADDLTPYGVTRDVRAEEQARRILEGFGVVPLECLDTWATGPFVEADYAVRCEGSVHDFCGFAAYVLPQLTDLGWKVEIADDYPYRVVDREPGWYAEVDRAEAPKGRRNAGHDWFSLELGIDVDGQRVNLLPALVELLESSGAKALADLASRGRKCLALQVGDGLFLPVPADRAKAILRVLAELYEGHGSIQENAIRFPDVRAGALADLELAFDSGEVALEVHGERTAIDRATRLAARPRDLERPPAHLRAELRPYQREGVAWLQHLRAEDVGGILADDMGLGKTLQTIAHLALEKEHGRLGRPALIVAPTSLVSNWVREIAKFAPHLQVCVLYGPDREKRWKELDGADVAITSYSILSRDEEHFEKTSFAAAILDEAQTIKNQSSRVHAAARKIDAEHRLCLTGTPVENHLGELWALIDFLNPGLLGDELHFGRFYRVPIEKLGDEERLAALRAVLAPYILRRLKRDVAKELPPKTEVQRPVELRGKQRELYESIRVAAHAEVRKLIKKKGLAASTVPILGALTKLRQLCCDPRLLRMDAASAVGESAKTEMFFDLLTRQLEGGHRVLVFSQFTSMLALLARGLVERRVPYSVLTGSTIDRGAAVEKFESGKASVFLISLKAGGTGLTLTSADVVIHYDPWWNPAVQAQATDRAYRIGQKKPVLAYNLFVAGSVEERILALQKKKSHVADAILGNGASTALTEDDLDVLFAPLGA
ncbi:MAG: DEAD/DEAH box helicase [Polyangiaceae bacterium]